MSGMLYRPHLLPISAKTAAYVITPADLGKIFTNRGASGTVLFTLPATADVQSGWWCRFFAAAGQALEVASAAVDEMITFNDADADKVGFNTSAELLGGAFEIVFDGTSWLVFIMAEETQTVTVTS